MSAARFAAAGISFGVCVLYGAVKRARSKCRMDELEGLIRDIVVMEAEVRLEKRPIEEIVCGLSEKGNCRRMWRAALAEMRSGTPLSRSLGDSGTHSADGEAEREIEELFSRSPTSDSVSFAERLSNSARKLEAILEKEKKQNLEKDKLTSSLSVFAGIAAALLIL